jgi:alpha-beta hydrolase superfamily lysophospholipase
MLAALLPGCAPTVIPAGPKAQAPRLTADHYVAADGTTLALATWPARNGHPKAVVLGLHGFGDYRDAFEEPAEIWSQAGIVTYSYDQRGFGQSPTRGRWPGTETLVEDARAVAALLRQRHPDLPLYVVGESMGGAVALVAADHSMEVDGLVLSAPAVRTRESFGPVASATLWFFAHTIPWLPAGPTSIDFRPTDNPKTLQKLQNDPLMLRQPRFDMGYGLLDLMDDSREVAPRVRVPYMILHGVGDRLVPDGPLKAIIEVLPPRADSKLAFYKSGYHLLMRDKDGPKVSADIAAWMSDHKARLPSGADAPDVQPKLANAWGIKRAREDLNTHPERLNSAGRIP